MKTTLYIKGRKLDLIPLFIVLGVVILLVGGTLSWVYLIKPAIEVSGRQKLVYNAEDGSYTDKKQGIVYLRAPVYYQASAILSDPVYGMADERLLYRVGEKTDGKFTLQSASDWLSTDRDHGMLLYFNSESVVVPDISEFEPDIVYICSIDGMTAAQSQIEASALFPEGFFDRTAENLIDSDAYTGASLMRQLRVTSKKYGFMHMVLYLYYNETLESYFIYLPQEKLFCEADSEMLDIFFASEDSLAGSSEGSK